MSRVKNPFTNVITVGNHSPTKLATVVMSAHTLERNLLVVISVIRNSAIVSNCGITCTSMLGPRPTCANSAQNGSKMVPSLRTMRGHTRKKSRIYAICVLKDSPSWPI